MHTESFKRALGPGALAQLTSCSLNLKLPNGNVDGEAQGPAPSLKAVHGQPHKGNPGAGPDLLVDSFDTHGAQLQRLGRGCSSRSCSTQKSLGSNPGE